MEDLLDVMDRFGRAVMPGFMGLADARRLYHECESAHALGDFRRAGVGRGSELQVREGIRRDRVLWLRPGEFSVEQEGYRVRLEALR